MYKQHNCYNPRRSMRLLISSVAVCVTLTTGSQVALAENIDANLTQNAEVQTASDLGDDQPDGAAGTGSSDSTDKGTSGVSDGDDKGKSGATDASGTQGGATGTDGTAGTDGTDGTAGTDTGKDQGAADGTGSDAKGDGTTEGDGADADPDAGAGDSKGDGTDTPSTDEGADKGDGKGDDDAPEIDAPVIEDGVYLIGSSKDNQKVLDVVSGSTSNGANVQLYESNMTSAQKWQFTYDKTTGYYTIGLAGTNKVLDVSGASTANGTNVQIYASNGTDAQLWKLVEKGGAYSLISKLKKDLAIDLTAGGTTNGTNVQVYTFNGTAAQLFLLWKTNPEVLPGEVVEGLEDGAYSIVAGSEDGKVVVAVSGGSSNSGANVTLANKGDSASQRFYFTSDGEGYYSIMAGCSGMYLEATNGNLIPGTNVRQASKSTSDKQKWALVRNEKDGSYTFVNKANGLALDVNGGALTSGSNVQVYTSNGTKAQKFWLKALTNLAAGDAAIVEDGTYVIESNNNLYQVVDVNGGSTSNGANVQTYQSNMTAAQKWDVKQVGNSGYYTIALSGTKKVLDVSCGQVTDGTNIQIYTSNGSDAQLWKFVKKGETYYIVSKLRPDLVVDISGGSTSNYANIQTYIANGTSAQKFRLLSTNPNVATSDEVAEGSYVLIVGTESGKQVIDIASGSRSDGSNAQIYQNNSTLAQRFYLKADGKGYYTITSLNSGKVLDVAGGNLVAGTNVQQWTAANGSRSQLWSLKANGDGSYSLISVANGLALDVSGGNLTNGANLQTYFSNGTKAQKFWLKSMAMFDAGTYEFETTGGTVFDISGASNADGGKLQVYESNDTLAQRFSVEYDATAGTYRIRTAASGGWLTDKSGSVQQYGSSKTEASESNTWKAIWNGTFFSLQNVGSGKVMSLSGGKTKSGTAIITSAASASKSQYFFLNAVKLIADGLYEIHSSGKSGKNLDVAGGSKDSGANVQVYTDNNSGAQKFRVTASGNGYVITGFASKKAVDVQNGSKDSGANVQIWDVNGSKAQLWIAQIADGGGVMFINANSGMALTAESNGNVDQKTASMSNANQAWTLEATFGSGWLYENGGWSYYYEDGSSRSFTNAAKTAYEAIKNWTSNTSYIICIDNSNFRTVIFEGSAGNWVPVGDWLCSVGKNPTNAEEAAEGYGATAKGPFTLLDKGYCFGNDPDYFYWCEFWQPYPGGEGQRFHSRPYYRNASNTPETLCDGGHFGYAQTHGCVRLDLENVRFIYYNCPLGTKVYSY